MKEILAIKTPDKSNICLYVKKYPKGKNTRITIYKVIILSFRSLKNLLQKLEIYLPELLKPLANSGNNGKNACSCS